MSYTRLNQNETACSISGKNTTDFSFDSWTQITRSGKICALTLLCSTNSAVSTWTDKVICTVSPAPPIVTYAVSRNNEGNTATIQIDTDGKVKLRTLSQAVASNFGIRCTAMYLC